MNSKGLGRKRPWPNSKNYPGICLEGLRKTTNKQPSRSPVRDLDPGPPKHEAGLLITRPRRSVCGTESAGLLPLLAAGFLCIFKNVEQNKYK
jgi:hypothetical protein